jgi:hypothetical protein
MKRCPECRRDYYDDSLAYCLDDGAVLLDGPPSRDEPATAILCETPSRHVGRNYINGYPECRTDKAMARSFKRLLILNGQGGDREALSTCFRILRAAPDSLFLTGPYPGHYAIDDKRCRSICKKSNEKGKEANSNRQSSLTFHFRRPPIADRKENCVIN